MHEGKTKMAEYDNYNNVQTYSNYQSYAINNDDDNKCTRDSATDRDAWNNKRKKNSHYNDTVTALKCQKPNKIYYNYRTTSTKTAANISAPSPNVTKLKQTTLISNPWDNNNSKSNNIDMCVISRSNMNNNNNKKYIDDNNNNNNNLTNNNKFYRLPIRKYFSCYNKSNAFTLALLVVISLLFKTNPCCGFVLDGTHSSFAQFRKWYTGLNGTLELEFKTEQPNGLVVYTDDGGTYDFFELKLVEGALRLRYNLGGGAQIITVGRDLHDGHWHKVQVSCGFFLLSILKLRKKKKTFCHIPYDKTSISAAEH